MERVRILKVRADSICQKPISFGTLLLGDFFAPIEPPQFDEPQLRTLHMSLQCLLKRVLSPDIVRSAEGWGRKPCCEVKPCFGKTTVNRTRESGGSAFGLSGVEKPDHHISTFDATV